MNVIFFAKPIVVSGCFSVVAMDGAGYQMISGLPYIYYLDRRTRMDSRIIGICRVSLFILMLLSAPVYAQGTLRHHRHPRVRVEAGTNLSDKNKQELQRQKLQRHHPPQRPPRPWQFRLDRKKRRPCKCHWKQD